ncbi:DUF881 domain-containing protein [Pseudactinotalea sp.]|uniref:DUF881 domain-containing protein n=1 Tax=Pseudactinotalea sp. TaxID=1926260 RepID=UPI003B3A5D03
MTERDVPPPAEPRPDASMTLLREVMERPLDAGYAEAAARREAGEAPSSGLQRAGRALLVAVLAAAIGLGGVWAARELRNPAPGPSARQLLVEQIRERSEITAGLVEENAGLRSEIQELQEQAFGDAAASTNAQAAELGIWAGTTAVAGPGVVITMADSSRAQAGEPGSENERVQDFDLQVVVNALWASGAESIAINGIRLTGSTAIRTAGSAVLVDLQPLVSPYQIEAIGDPEGMRTSFARTSGAAHLSALSSAWGITSQLVVADDLQLPAGSTSTMASTVPSDQG